MNSNFFYQPKEALIRVNSPSKNGLNMNRKTGHFSIANHQSPPALRYKHSPKRKNMHSEYFNGGISRHIPISPQIVLEYYQ